MKIHAYLKNQYRLFLNSFDFRRFMYILLINLAAFIFLYLAWGGFSDALTALGQQMNALEIQGSVGESELGSLQAMNSSLQGILSRIWTYIFLFVAAAFMLWVVSQLTIWLMVVKSDIFKKGFARINAAYFKFLVLNFLWFLIWSIPLVFVMVLVYQTAQVPEQLLPLSQAILALFALSVLGIFIFLSGIAYYNFARSFRIGRSIGLAFSTGFGKIHYFIVPGAINFLLSVAAALIALPFRFLPESLFSWIYFVLYLAQSAWITLFFAKIFSKIQKKFPHLDPEHDKKKR